MTAERPYRVMVTLAARMTRISASLVTGTDFVVAAVGIVDYMETNGYFAADFTFVRPKRGRRTILDEILIIGSAPEQNIASLMNSLSIETS